MSQANKTKRIRKRCDWYILNKYRSFVVDTDDEQDTSPTPPEHDATSPFLITSSFIAAEQDPTSAGQDSASLE